MVPLIAVTGRNLEAERIARWREDAVALPRFYADALGRAGALAAVLQPTEVEAAVADEWLDRFDGLVLTGGVDVDPARYRADPHPEVYGVDPQSDAFELALIEAAIGRGMPVLCICRGMQLLNVARGGTLDQHIAGRPELIDHGYPRVGPSVHPVKLQDGSRLATAMAVERADCSSHHHQAVDAIGEGLRPVAWSDDGLIEAVELGGDAWVVGVQWHPEDTAADDPAQQRLFDAFVTAAAAAAAATAANDPNVR